MTNHDIILQFCFYDKLLIVNLSLEETNDEQKEAMRLCHMEQKGSQSDSLIV